MAVDERQRKSACFHKVKVDWYTIAFPKAMTAEDIATRASHSALAPPNFREMERTFALPENTFSVDTFQRFSVLSESNYTRGNKMTTNQQVLIKALRKCLSAI